MTHHWQLESMLFGARDWEHKHHDEREGGRERRKILIQMKA